MKKSIVFLKQYSFIYKNNEYDICSFDEEIKNFNRHMKIIILDEQLFMKLFYIKRKIKVFSDFIQEKIDNVFPQSGDILYDYQIDKVNKKIGIYSVKGKRNVEKLSSSASSLEVIPVQFIVRDMMVKEYKDKNITCNVIFKALNNFYYVYIKDGFIYENYISEDIKQIFAKISVEDNSVIYIDENINIDIEMLKKFKFLKIKIGEMCDEKLYKK